MRVICYSLMIIILCQSCTPSCDYQYRENLEKFLLNEVQYTIPDEETILVFLPLDGCQPCLSSTIEMLIENQEENLSIVISSTDTKTIAEFGLDRLTIPESKKLFDRKNNYERYEIGVVAPMIFHFKNKKCLFHSETTDNLKPAIKKHFGWH